MKLSITADNTDIKIHKINNTETNVNEAYEKIIIKAYETAIIEIHSNYYIVIRGDE